MTIAMVVSHDLPTEPVIDRVIRMHKGRIAGAE